MELKLWGRLLGGAFGSGIKGNMDVESTIEDKGSVGKRGGNCG